MKSGLWPLFIALCHGIEEIDAVHIPPPHQGPCFDLFRFDPSRSLILFFNRSIVSTIRNVNDRAKIAEMGGIEAILNAMGGHQHDADVQKSCCEALRCLAVDVDNQVVIVKHASQSGIEKVKIAWQGGIEAILKALEEEETEEEEEDLGGMVCVWAVFRYRLCVVVYDVQSIAV